MNMIIIKLNKLNTYNKNIHLPTTKYLSTISTMMFTSI